MKTVNISLQTVFDNALRLALTNNPAPHIQMKKTTHRTITRRGVVWLGQTCNLHCEFCYFIDKIHSGHHPEHAFMSLEKAKKICKTLVEFYGNNAVDIQGGEPTLYREIFELVHYCRGIGLIPTLITNGLRLDEKETCRNYKDAGIRDFLISIHGLGDTYDMLVGRNGAHARQMKALRNLQEIGIPFRFNCVLSKPVLEQLHFISDLAIKTGARVVNFIAFNPFEDQSKKGRRSTSNVPRYTDVRKPLTNAIDVLEAAGIEMNVRYFPICMLEDRHRKYAYNFQQLPYDHHEWDYASWAWTGLQPQRMKEGDPSNPVQLSTSRWIIRIKRPFKNISKISFLRNLLYKVHHLISKSTGERKEKDILYRKIAKVHAELHCRYAYGKKCALCIANDICDGFHGDYAQIFGTGEAVPIIGDSPIGDPMHYIRHQEKVVEKEDESWALPGGLF
ncbi:MAG: radical SAM protein [Nitrospirota bacterium]